MEKNNDKQSLSSKKPFAFPWLPSVACVFLVFLFFLYEQPGSQESNKGQTTAISTEEKPLPKKTENTKKQKTTKKVEAKTVKTENQLSSQQTKQHKPQVIKNTKVKASKQNNKPKNKNSVPSLRPSNIHVSADKQEPEIISIASINQEHPISNSVMENTSRTAYKEPSEKPNSKCINSSYKHYYSQQIKAQKWLRDSIISSNPALEKQAHYEYSKSKQFLDDEAQILKVLLKLKPELLNTKTSINHWLPPISRELRQQLCRYDDTTCQAVIRYSVPTSSLNTQKETSVSPYQVALKKYTSTNTYISFSAATTLNCH